MVVSQNLATQPGQGPQEARVPETCFRDLIECNPDAIMIIDQDGGFCPVCRQPILSQETRARIREREASEDSEAARWRSALSDLLFLPCGWLLAECC